MVKLTEARARGPKTVRANFGHLSIWSFGYWSYSAICKNPLIQPIFSVFSQSPKTPSKYLNSTVTFIKNAT
jgi:hypothetical protein